MGKDTAIEWTTHTHNFWYGCQKVSPGCAKCYAERDMKRYGRDFGAITRAKQFAAPLSWREPALVFTCSWSDFFLEEADAWRDEAWRIIRDTPHLTYQILTKRPENIASRLPEDWDDLRGYPNVWLGVSAETQRYADQRIPILLSIPARLHFVSAEPLLGPLNLSRYLTPSFFLWPAPAWRKLGWVIAGGESDLSAPRPADDAWFRSLRDQCKGTLIPESEEPSGRTPYFLKQLGGRMKIDGSWGGNMLDHRVHREMPDLAPALDHR